MTGALVVLEPGLHTTLQDLGRFGHQALGVPVAGALDQLSLRLTNAVVGNPQRVGALEVLYAGPTLEVDAGSVRVAASAAEIEVLTEPLQRVAPWHSLRLERGVRFRLGALPGIACSYLAVEAGFAVAPVLGSQSTFVRSAIGGFAGRALRAGDVLPLRRDAVEVRSEVRLAQPPDLAVPAPIRVTLGPQREHFTDAAIATLLGEDFTVSKEADRMGLRLCGPRLEHTQGFNIVSDGIVTGAIQVPGSGQPIILLADHQTTGGYPKIATVISADLPAVGRLKPGDRLRFEAVSVADAEAARVRLEADLHRRAASLVPIRSPAVVRDEALYACNLVSGVVNASE